MIYKIRDWDKYFENNRTRELKNLQWVPMPNKHDGDGFTEVMEQERGVEVYGAWALILQIASKCNPRGTLVRDNPAPSCGDPAPGCGGGQKAHDSASLARMTRTHRSVFDHALPILVQVGWLDVIPEAESLCEIPHPPAGLSHPPAVIPHPSAASRARAEGNGMEGNGMEKNTPPKQPGEETATKVASMFSEPETEHPGEIESPAAVIEKQIAQLYEAYPKKVDPRTTAKAIRAALKRAPFEIILAGVRKYAAARAGQDKQYTKNSATWFNANAWENEIEERIDPDNNLDPDDWAGALAERIGAENVRAAQNGRHA